MGNLYELGVLLGCLLAVDLCIYMSGYSEYKSKTKPFKAWIQYVITALPAAAAISCYIGDKFTVTDIVSLWIGYSTSWGIASGILYLIEKRKKKA